MWIEEDLGVKNLFTNVFKTRFKSSHDQPRNFDLGFLQPFVSNMDCNMLTAPITNQQIKEAFFDTNPHKAPCFDGFKVNFF